MFHVEHRRTVTDMELTTIMASPESKRLRARMAEHGGRVRYEYVRRDPEAEWGPMFEGPRYSLNKEVAGGRMIWAGWEFVPEFFKGTEPPTRIICAYLEKAVDDLIRQEKELN